ncbi:MAG: hypothetical protein WBC93_20840 [Sulfitobacter sp.]
MIGIVLWSDLDDQKAVFWCEDHGDLAYYDASLDKTEKESRLIAGDMVQFDVSVERSTRRAQNARILKGNVCSGLQEHLRETAELNRSAETAARQSEEVLSFRQKQPTESSDQRVLTG